MANDIDKTSPHYKGDFGSIYEVNKKFPTGGVAGDFVVIEGWAHYWNADRATWCVNAERDSYWDELITNIIEKFKLFRGATYMGVASLDTVPAKVIGAKMYYFATVAGTYKNFGDLTVPQGINVLYSENGSSWVNTTLLEVAQELGVSTKKVVSQKALNDALNLKANQSSVNEALAKKADKEETNRLLGEKANTTDVDTKFTEEKKRVDGELDKKFDKESVVQESGEAEDKVMSQKAVSDKLSDLSNFYDKDNIELYRNTTPIEVSQIVDGYYISQNLVPKVQNNWHYAYYPVEEGKTYLIKGTVSGWYAASICTASDIGTFTKAIVTTQRNNSIRVEMALTIEAGIKYVVFSYYGSSKVFLFEKDNNSTKSRIDKHDSEIADLAAKLYADENIPIEKETEKYCYYDQSGNFVSRDVNFNVDYYPVNTGDKVKVDFTVNYPIAGLVFVAEKRQQTSISFSDIGHTGTSLNVSKIISIPDGVKYIGISYRIGETTSAYQNSKHAVNELISEKTDKSYVDSELTKKFDKANVVQESGEAEDKVMSQKAIYDILNTTVETALTLDSTDKGKYYGASGNYYTDASNVFKIDYYPVKEGQKVHLTGSARGSISMFALVVEKGEKAVSMYGFPSGVDNTITIDTIITIPSGVNWIARSYSHGATTIPYLIERKVRFNQIKSAIDELEKKIKSQDDAITDLTNKVKSTNQWQGKTLLAIGDSITAQKFWQTQVGELLGMKVRNHCKGGIGIITMVDGDGSGNAPEGYDPDTFGVSKLYKLNTEDVKDVSVVILMGFYNERRDLDSKAGVISDMYPTQETFMGSLNYAIKRVYEELAKANNNSCRVVICSAHRYGKYSYLDKDGYEDGDKLLECTKMVAEYNSVPCIDLMHNGGINKYNWNLFQACPSTINQNYIPADGMNDGTNKPFENQESFPSASENKGKKVSVKGSSGTYTSNGTEWVWSWEPYPWIGDQLHLSAAGGKLLGNYIAAQLLSL